MSMRFICIIYNLSAILLRITACCSWLQALKSSLGNTIMLHRQLHRFLLENAHRSSKQLVFMSDLTGSRSGRYWYKKSVFNPLYRNSWHKRWISIWTRTYHLDWSRRNGQTYSALKNFTPTRKEHILRTCLITIVLAYSTFFYGAWYGINKSAGYAIRYYFAEISTICVSVTLSCLLIWGMICLYKKAKKVSLIEKQQDE